MYVLGLNIGHNATACLLKDGTILGCVSEERFSRIKNHSGIPFQSIKFLLEDNKTLVGDVDLVVLDNHYDIDKDPYFGKRFLEAYTKKPFPARVKSYLGYHYPGLFKVYKNYKENKQRADKVGFVQKLREGLSKQINVPKNKIVVIDHHFAHASSTVFNLKKNTNTLIFTLDGEGSGISASVNIFDGKKIKTIARSSKSTSLGYLYSTATMFLGMKPLEHEFKVMGLAPYAKEHDVKKLEPIFKKILRVNDSLEFESSFNMPFADHFFQEEMKFKRFDNISAAVQNLLEDLVCEWITKAIKKTGISNIALAGGVFMNVKANMKIAQLPEVKSVFVMPSAGDESNPIGCCLYGYQLLCLQNNIEFNPSPLNHLYLGPEYGDDYVERLIRDKELKSKYIIKKVKNINQEVGKLLAKGEIVARCSGKSEWGARALGNRSILANPSHGDTIRILNETIKDRDFWMPFTPSMLDSAEKRYVINPKKIFAPYMVITFPSTELAQKDLPAAMHPYDFTIRPQIVMKEYNSDYYEVIKQFEKLTGIGAVLNTSFNLHGEPNVLTPEDALRTVENSALKYLAMGNYLFQKR